MKGKGDAIKMKILLRKIILKT